MRHFLVGKDHKKNKSLKLQQKLQSEEDKLWQEEQERRRQQELLDEKVARKVQEELEQGQRQRQPRRQRQRQSSPLESDEALARRLQREYERTSTRSCNSVPQSPLATANSDQILLDGEYARRLQEEFDAESEGRHVVPPVTPQRTSTVSPIPPLLPLKPVAYHSTNHLVSTTEAGGSSRLVGRTSSSSASPSSPPDPSIVNTSGHPVPPPTYTPSSSSSWNNDSGYAAANNTDMHRTRRERSGASLNAEGLPLAANIPSVYTDNHSPLTTYAPQRTTTTAATEVMPIVRPSSSQSHVTIPVLSPLSTNAPSAPRVSYAQFHSLHQQSPCHPQINGTFLPQQSEAQQQKQTQYNTTSYPVSNGQQPQQKYPDRVQTVGARLFSGHSNGERVDTVTSLIPLPQRNQDELISPQKHLTQHVIPDFMSISVPPAVTRIDWATPLPPHTRSPMSKGNTTAALQLEETSSRHGRMSPHPPIGILNTGHKPDVASPRDATTSDYNHGDDGYTDTDDDNFSDAFIFRRKDSPVKENKAVYEEPMGSSGELDPFSDTHVVDSTQPSEDEDDEEIQLREIPPDVLRGTQSPATTTTAATKSNWASHPSFNPVNYLDDDDLVDLDPEGNGSPADDSSSDSGSIVMISSKRPPTRKIGVTVAIQTDPVGESSGSAAAAANKEASDCAIATRVDPTFGIAILSPGKIPGSTSFKNTDDESILALRTLSMSDMQTHLEGSLVDISTDDIVHYKVDKTQMTQEPLVPGRKDAQLGLAMHRHHYSYSMPSLASSSGTGQLKYQKAHHPATPQVMTPTIYHDTLYTSTQMIIHNDAPYHARIPTPGATPGPYRTGEVPLNEYGYYPVENSTEQDGLSRPNNSIIGNQKPLPEIPKSDPNQRHITVPSIDPSQRVWIRVHPADTGKDLAQRIHIVATYRTRKILSIKTAHGRSIPLDNTPVFDDWTDIEELADGVPWQVEWGPLDDPFSGGRQLLKHIAANLRATVMD